jgi:hypothetical protein
MPDQTISGDNDEPPSSKRLPHGGLPEIISPHLHKLITRTGGPKGPIGLQFIAQPVKEKNTSKKASKIL